jgi:uncharacterized protein YjiS (DUF1127 family)
MMRDYIIHEAQARQAYGRLNLLARLFRNWRLRKEIRQLLACSDFALRDMGLERVQLLQWRDLPLTRDIYWELERCGVSTDQAPAASGSAVVNAEAISPPSRRQRQTAPSH